jgi:uncharacterized damage-inducible protein DinB
MNATPMSPPKQMPQPWLERDWHLWKSTDDTETILEALGRFPESLKEHIDLLDSTIWIKQADGKWSIQEHVGHLLAMESLWIARIDDFVMGHEFLRPWNGNNNDVLLAQFNVQKMRALLRDFDDTRSRIVNFLTEILPDYKNSTVRHERLNRAFSLHDQISFMHEHDCHHLQIIQFLSQP